MATVTTLKDANNSNDYLFEFGEDIVNFAGEKAKVEEINLSVGQQSPIAKLRYTIGTGTTNVEVISYGSTTQVSEPPPAGTFEVNKQYQFGSEITQLLKYRTQLLSHKSWLYCVVSLALHGSRRAVRLQHRG